MQCANNLKQVGLAMHNYISTNGTLPIGWVANYITVGDAPDCTGLISLLPYLEQQNVPYHFNVRQYDNSNLQAIGTQINAYLCPSDNASGASCFKRTPARTWSSRLVAKGCATRVPIGSTMSAKDAATDGAFQIDLPRETGGFHRRNLKYGDGLRGDQWEV